MFLRTTLWCLEHVGEEPKQAERTRHDQHDEHAEHMTKIEDMDDEESQGSRSISDEQIKYNEKNIDNIKNLLLKNGYKLRINKSKMTYTIGPFADISHAKEESSKLTKVLGIDNKISNFVF